MPDNISRLMDARIDSPPGHTQALSVIQNDPGLCADLLHLANDSCCEADGTVETIDDAVKHVGIQPLLQVIGVSYAGKTIRQEFAALKHLDQYFQHSREISRCCSIMAEVLNLPGPQREMYAVIGLIHDIGRLVIMIAGNKTSLPLMGTSWEEMLSIVRDEKQVLGLDHCEVGMQLCSKWNFSAVLNQGVLRHHTPLVDDDFNSVGAIIFIAHFVALSDFTGQMLVQILPAELLDRLDLSRTGFQKAQDTYNSLYRE